MKRISTLCQVCVWLVAVTLQAETADSILARMDQAAPAFKGASADVSIVSFTAVLNDKTTQVGTMKMQRLKPGDTRAILDLSAGGDGQVIAFLGKKIRVYSPKGNFYQDYEVGDKSKEVNQLLLLGFGSSGKELRKSYNVTAVGEEKVAGTDTTKLLLVPTDPKVAQRFVKIEMWIPTGGVSPSKQKFYEPSGNSRETSYSNIVINPNFGKTLEYKLPPGARQQS